MVYSLWIMLVSIVIVVIVVNIGKVYAVKQQAATATQQAALAGTSVLVNATKKGIEEFDSDEESAEQKEADDGKSISELVEEKTRANRQAGEPKSSAYIHALNEVLPERIAEYSLLNEMITKHVKNVSSTFTTTINKVVSDNAGNKERITVTFALPDYRVEVKADVTFNSITDSNQTYMESMTKEIPQKGYGPSLVYLKGTSWTYGEDF